MTSFLAAFTHAMFWMLQPLSRSLLEYVRNEPSFTLYEYRLWEASTKTSFPVGTISETSLYDGYTFHVPMASPQT